MADIPKKNNDADVHTELRRQTKGDMDKPANRVKQAPQPEAENDKLDELFNDMPV